MKWLTVAEVAEQLRVDRETVRGWCRSGRLPAARAGGQYRISQTALDNFLNRPQKGDDEKKSLAVGTA